MPHAVVLIFTQVNLDTFDAAVSFVNVNNNHWRFVVSRLQQHKDLQRRLAEDNCGFHNVLLLFPYVFPVSSCAFKGGSCCWRTRSSPLLNCCSMLQVRNNAKYNLTVRLPVKHCFNCGWISVNQNTTANWNRCDVSQFNILCDSEIYNKP